MVERTWQWDEAWRTGDRAALEDLLAERFTRSAHGRLLSKRHYIDSALGGHRSNRRQRLKITVRFQGADAVVQILAKGATGLLRHTEIWANQEGSWRAVSQHVVTYSGSSGGVPAGEISPA